MKIDSDYNIRIFIYHMFLRYLKENRLYYEYITYGTYSKNKKSKKENCDLFLEYLRMVLTKDHLSHYTYNLIDAAFTWSDCNTYFNNNTDWNKYHVKWGELLMSTLPYN